MIEARLTSGSGPVASADIAFFFLGTGPGGFEGALIQTVATDPDGYAQVSLDGGLESLVRPDQTISGYQAEFGPSTTVVEGEEYCAAKTQADVD